MILQKSQILSAHDIQIKIKRMAFEILERNYHATEIILAGVVKEGALLATMIADELRQVSHVPVTVVEIKISKSATSQPDIVLDISEENLIGRTIIIVDDVLNTGKTIAYALKPFLNLQIEKLQVAVLVDRNHRKYPVSADFIGYALSTTLSDHVEAILDAGDKFGVYLI